MRAAKMKVTGASIFILAAAVSVATAITIIPDCSQTQCPPRNCSDPRPVDGQCCQTCEGSSCVWRGCVHFGAFGAQWYPNPCTVCGCQDGAEVCTKIVCETPECFGFPLRTDPNSCCPKCDWGIPNNDCRPIPVANVSLYVALGDAEQCQYEVTTHQCDKRYVQKNGDTYECRSKMRGRPVDTQGCRNIRKVIYEDIGTCRLKRLRALPLDFDPNPTECNLVVPP